MMYPWYQAHWQALLLLQAALGTWVFAYGLKRRPHFVWRAAFSLMVGAFLAEGTTRLLWHFSGWAQLLTVSLIYGLLILVGFICFEESIWTVMFVASSGYMLQDIASNIKQLLRLWSWVNGFMQTNVGLICIDALCYGGCCLLAHRVFRHETDRVEVEFNDKIKVAFSVGVLLICACLSRLSRIAPALIHGDLGCGHAVVICMYQVVLGAFMLLLQYGVMERTRLDRYVDTMQELLHQQHLQYETSKENAELVSEKYHDFKKMIEGLRRNNVNEKALDKLEKSVEQYDMAVHTGNDVLDILLNEKRSNCAAYDIELTCFAGAKTSDIMEDIDLYFLLNNALSNAVEAVQGVPQGKRFISLTMQRDADMLSIHMENPYAGTVEMRDGLPQTQNDPDYHGFGMRSMQRITEKYNGSLTVQPKDGLFLLDILLFKPLQ